MRILNLDHVIQVGGTHALIGTQEIRSLSNPYVVGRDGSEAEVLQKYRTRLMQGIKAGEPSICTGLRRLCERAEELRAAGFELSLAYNGAGNSAAAEVLAKCVDWLLSQSMKPLAGKGQA